MYSCRSQEYLRYYSFQMSSDTRSLEFHSNQGCGEVGREQFDIRHHGIYTFLVRSQGVCMSNSMETPA